MIKPKELVGRLYDGRDCIGFSYWLEDQKHDKVKLVQFFKAGNAWEVKVNVNGTHWWQDTVDPVTYGKIENIAANGLMKFQNYLEHSIQDEQVICYYSSLATRGM